MAGIGFELRKMYAQKGLFSSIRAYAYSVAIIMGPTLLCVVMLTLLQQLPVFSAVPGPERELFTAGVMYSFVFSMMFTGGFNVLLSRYSADRLYCRERRMVVPSLEGTAAICVPLGGIAALLFYCFSPADILFKTCAYLLFMELILIWIQSVYITATKDSGRLFKGFAAGVTAVILSAIFFVNVLDIRTAWVLMLSMDLGFFTILGFFSAGITSCFGKGRGNRAAFLKYAAKYPSLIFCGFFNVLGMYAHNIMFWIFGDNKIVGGTYAYVPFYDLPSFWAFLSVIPALVAYVVIMETALYEKCKVFYRLVSQGGVYCDIDRAKKEMLGALSGKYVFMLLLQICFSLFYLSAGGLVLPLLGFTADTCRVFTIMTGGYYAYAFMQITYINMLYFDDRRGALTTCTVFLLSNILFTGATLLLGKSFYGLGFASSAAVSLAYALIRVNSFLKNIEYHTYCTRKLSG